MRMFRIAHLEHVINDLNGKLGDATQGANQALQDAQNYGNDQKNRADKAEWELGEHKGWLGDANNRIAQLENELAGVRDELSKVNIPSVDPEEVVQLKNRVGELEGVNQAKDNIQNELNDQRNRADKAEWDLGETKGWLNDANNK